MAFDLTALLRRLETGFDRDDLSDRYRDYINTALHEIYNQRSFQDMRHRVNIVLPSGQIRVRLPADYKELATERSPISVIDQYNNTQPCDVLEQHQLERFNARFTGYPYPSYGNVFPASLGLRTRLPVFIDEDDQTKFLSISTNPQWTAGEDLNFQVTYYRYLPPLLEGTDTNGIVRKYFEMVVDKSKSIAFSDINDPIAEQFDKAFEKKMEYASKQDAYSRLAGRRLQM